MSYRPSLWPVPVTAVAQDHEVRVLLPGNEHEEWELPGGRLEIGPPSGPHPADRSPEETTVREPGEESGWDAGTGELLGTWIHEPVPGRRVLILTYDCAILAEVVGQACRPQTISTPCPN
ncbi:hypothetical protein [Streptomyces sp. NPDC056061]|uniref:hypothetical protein n=1 Tax=Streptomyces sp. NPDC056061 TaxID=3345700 RepID=UPI0035DEF4FC